MSKLFVLTHGKYSEYIFQEGIHRNTQIIIIDKSSSRFIIMKFFKYLNIEFLFKLRLVRVLMYRILKFLLFGLANLNGNRVIFFQMNYAGKLDGFSKYLKSKYPNLITLYYMTNRLSKRGAKKINFLKKDYDFLLTYSKYDSQKYNLIHAPIPISYDVEKLDNNCSKKHTIYFNGTDKNRNMMLHRIAQKLDSLEISYKFIVYKQSPNTIEFPEIKYVSRSTNYLTILKESHCSDILLDLYSDEFKKYKDYSLRLTEGFLLGKKIITNNKNLIREEFYDPERIFVFEDLKEFPNIVLSCIKQEKKEIKLDYFSSMKPLLNIINNL